MKIPLFRDTLLNIFVPVFPRNSEPLKRFTIETAIPPIKFENGDCMFIGRKRWGGNIDHMVILRSRVNRHPYYVLLSYCHNDPEAEEVLKERRRLYVHYKNRNMMGGETLRGLAIQKYKEDKNGRK